MIATDKIKKVVVITIFFKIIFLSKKIKILKDGLTITQIADRLSRNKSSIYREIKSGTVELRNSDWSIRKEYSAYHSIIVHQHAMSKTGKKKKLATLMPDLLNYIQNKLNAKYSP